jgi:hypothetical protein
MEPHGACRHASNVSGGRLLASKENAMTRQVARHNRPVSNALHPYVYAAMAGLLLLYVISAWIFFHGEYNDIALAVVSGFFLMFGGIPFLIALTWRRRHAEAEEPDQVSFRDWATGEFETNTGRRKATDALVECVLPIAAVGLGLLAFGIIFYISEVHSNLV